MIVVAIVYAVCAATLMTWSTLLAQSHDLKPRARESNIEYVLIPSFLLSEWTVCYLDLLLFDIREDCETKPRNEKIPGSLLVRRDELQHLFRWLPPRSTIVLIDEGMRSMTPAIENLLVELGIDTVYFLDRTKFPGAVAWNQFVHRS